MNLKIGMMCVFLSLINVATALRISSRSQHHIKAAPTGEKSNAMAQQVLLEAKAVLKDYPDILKNAKKYNTMITNKKAKDEVSEILGKVRNQILHFRNTVSAGIQTELTDVGKQLAVKGCEIEMVSRIDLPSKEENVQDESHKNFFSCLKKNED
eukprot:Platyproteum_vivax@DN5034_c0_g1_i1.p1